MVPELKESAENVEHFSATEVFYCS